MFLVNFQIVKNYNVSQYKTSSPIMCLVRECQPKIKCYIRADYFGYNLSNKQKIKGFQLRALRRDWYLENDQATARK